MSLCSPSGMNKPTAHRRKVSPLTPDAKRFCHDKVFIVTNILILLCASASAGFAIGLVLFRAEAIVLTSLFLALLSAALPPCHGFGLVGDVLISAGLLAALQSFYLVGAFMRYLVMDN